MELVEWREWVTEASWDASESNEVKFNMIS